MKKMIYKVETDLGADGVLTQTYEGFKRFKFARNKAIPVVVAAVCTDDGTEMWTLDSRNVEAAVEELQRYYRSEHNLEVDVLVYKQASLFLHDELDPLED